MTNAPTTRETPHLTSLHKVQTSADHAKLLAGKACGDRMLAVADALMPWLKNYPPSTRRERAIEAANAAIAASCAPLLSEIAALRGRAEEADALASTHFVALREKQDDAAILKHGKLEAERQRDELRKALERLASSEAFETSRVIDGPLAPEMRARMSYARQALANHGADKP